MITKLANEFVQKVRVPPASTTAEVSALCKEMKLQDWTKLPAKNPSITNEEAQTILDALLLKDAQKNVPIGAFTQGLKVELEHGSKADGVNLTNNNPLYTGMIALAHLKESSKYYDLLEKMEEKL